MNRIPVPARPKCGVRKEWPKMENWNSFKNRIRVEVIDLLVNVNLKHHQI